MTGLEPDVEGFVVSLAALVATHGRVSGRTLDNARVELGVGSATTVLETDLAIAKIRMVCALLANRLGAPPAVLYGGTIAGALTGPSGHLTVRLTFDNHAGAPRFELKLDR